jgi:hypothetical protein
MATKSDQMEKQNKNRDERNPNKKAPPERGFQKLVKDPA